VLEAFKETHETMMADVEERTELVDAEADPGPRSFLRVGRLGVMETAS
jgi:hypothetical protein